MAVDNGNHGASMPQMFLANIGHDRVNPRVAQGRYGFARTALHLVAGQLTRIQYAPSTWVDFVRQLLWYGLDIHQRTKLGTPFTYLLQCGSWDCFSWLVKSWASLLQAVGIDLLSYGRKEKVIWSAHSPRGIKGHEFMIKNWTYGATADDWTVDVLREITIPIYEMIGPPGAWPSNSEYAIETICWYPAEDDSPTGLWHWSKLRDVQLYFHPETTLKNKSSLESAKYHHNRIELGMVQDDCRPIMRLIQSSSKVYKQPRSCSEPPRKASYRKASCTLYSNGHRWLPRYHYCQGTGRIEFGGYYNGSERRCVKGSCNSHLDDGLDYQGRILRQMRRFRTRYHDVAELRSLPYAAYHPTWKRDGPSVVEEL